MIKAVIFDLDNTLLDFIKMKENAIRAAVLSMKEAGLNLDSEKSFKDIFSLYEEIGWENQKIFNEYLTKTLGYVDNKFLAAGIVAYRRAREASLQLYPNVNRCLFELLKMGVRLSLVSDAPSREAWLRIYHLNLHHLFDLVLTFDETKARKPSPVPFKMALEKMGISADETLMIGDWPERDVVGAKKVGIRTIFAKYGDTFGTEFSGADYDLDDISEILGIIKKENNV